MGPTAAVAKPAIPGTLALLAGVALAEALRAAPGVWAIVALAPLLPAIALRRCSRMSARALLLLALLGLGGWRMAHEEWQIGARAAEWLPSEGSAVELHFEGRVLRTPEATWEGERLLLVRGRPERLVPGVPDVVVRLRVRRSPPDAAARLDGLSHGDRVRAWCRLRRPTARGNPGAADPLRALRARGLDLYGSVKSARLVELLESGPPGPLRAIDRIKRAARRRLDLAFGGEPAVRGVLGAMLLGDRAGLDPRLMPLFRDSGLMHLLAISGLHVGVATLLVIGALRRVRLPPPFVWLIAGLLFCFLALLVGARPPVVRATLASGLLLAGRAVGRDGDPLNALAVVAAVLVASNPWLLWSAAFQLSFLATAGILSVSPSVCRGLPLGRPLRVSLSISVGAYLATAPAAARCLGRLAPVSVLSNLAAVPLCAGILLSGAGAVLLSDVPLLGAALRGSARLLVHGLLAVGSAVASHESGAFAVARPGPLLVGGYLLLLAAWALATDSPKARRVLGLGLAACLVLLHIGPPPPGPPARPEVAVLDVGQGQAIVLRGPAGGFLLVDAASSSGGRFDLGERVVAPALRHLGCRRLAVLALTHEHDDHAGGAGAILRQFEVGEVWIAAGSHRSPRVRRLADRARERGAAIVLIERGRRWSREGIEFEFLHPDRGDLSLSVNDRSSVVVVGRAPARLLIPGDLALEGERRNLARHPAKLEAEALIVGHHGSRQSTGAAWLEAVRPAVAVISAGSGNRFGHPDPTVLDRLGRRGTRVFRTDRHGMVRLSAGPDGWSVQTRWHSGDGQERDRDEGGREHE